MPLSAALGGTVVALLIVTITLSVLVILLAMKVKQLKLASKLHKYILIHTLACLLGAIIHCQYLDRHNFASGEMTTHPC